MNESDFPHLHAYRRTAGDDGSPQAAPTVDRNTFIANLHRIGSGAAADGQPWPERHQLPGRCLALADADCALSGLRVVLECCWRPNAPGRMANPKSTWATG